MMKTERNNTIDLLRLIMAWMIVALHASPFAEYNAIISYFPSQVLSRLGVPFFAAVSGYFFFTQLDVRKICHTITKYFSLYLLWSRIMLAYQFAILGVRGVHLSIY